MSKTVTLRLSDDTYSKFRSHAENDNRNLSNFIETSVLRYISEHEYIDDFEMDEINANQDIQNGLRRAFKDAKKRKGQFVK